ncbi:hypothetical protein NPA08_02035 [Mycoplasmopsis citelli]|uniref:Glucose-6-phosphate isomerase n=1 Tax=Mycoplasmopsis citelli TaxID=171281 RepID=A0A449B0Y2_9BACT|nr:hypothetical protein [Mycoplasmopsis citelli]UUD36586.1 hypothetical protein NPA08_02035 [Mycoplasmopsis citelli]VEU74223.1 Uncharacterised protein [Mycoplasmopsis citelli]
MEIPKLRRSNVTFVSKNKESINFANNELYQKILKQINSLKFENSEYLSFSDIAENFHISGVEKIIKLVNYFYNKEYNSLVIFTNTQVELEFLAIKNFVLSAFDPYEEYKIKCIFINSSDVGSLLIEKLKYLQSLKDNKSAFIFTDYFGNSNQINNYFQITRSFLSKNIDEKILKNNLFYIGKFKLSLNDFYTQLNEKNIFFTADDIHDKFVAFSDLTLFLIATQGINIKKFVRGYCKILKRFIGNNWQTNDAFKFASFVHFGQFKTITFISNFKETEIFSKLFAYEFNTINLGLNCWFDYLNFTDDCAFIAQCIINGNINNTKALINFEISYPNYDFQFTSDINNIDNLSDFDLLTLNDIQKTSQKTLFNYSESMNPDIFWMNLQIENTKEESCAMVIAFLYWSKIFLSLINNQSPFKN